MNQNMIHLTPFDVHLPSHIIHSVVTEVKHTNKHIYIYIYICMYVCMYVCIPPIHASSYVLFEPCARDRLLSRIFVNNVNCDCEN
jgi:hypothetical protein